MFHKIHEGRIVRFVGLILAVVLSVYIGHSIYGFALPATSEIKASELQTAITIGSGSGVLIFGTLAFLLLMHKRSSEFMIEVDTEGRKVHWPDWLTVKSSTIQVMAVMFSVMVFIFLIDMALGFISERLYTGI